MNLVNTDPVQKKKIIKILMLILVVFLSYLWTSHTSRLLMQQWGWDLKIVTPTPMWISQVLSILLMTSFAFSLTYLKKINKGLILIFLGYLVWFGFLFLSYAPGCLTEDSYYTFHMVKHGWWSAWYSTMHPAFITALLQIFPYDDLAPGLALATFWAFTFTVIHNILFSYRAKRLAHLWPILLLLTPATIAASLIIVRDSYFTALLILFFLLIFKTISSQVFAKKIPIFLIGLLGAILMVYRADAIPSVVLGLAVVFYTKNFIYKNTHNKLSSFTKMIIPVIILFAFFSTIPHLFNSNWVKGNTWENRAQNEYKLTLIENPLGFIARDSHAIIPQSDRIGVEKVFKFSDLSQYYCPENICVFYGNHWNKDSTPVERNLAFNSALDIFMRNPSLFLQSKIQTLNMVGEHNSQTVCSTTTMSERGFRPLYLNDSLFKFGQNMISVIQKTETANGSFGGSRIWWNVYLWSFVCFLLILTMYWTPAVSTVALLLFIRTSVVFISAPAGFTVYYLTLFIGVPILILLWGVELKNRSSRKFIDSPLNATQIKKI